MPIMDLSAVINIIALFLSLAGATIMSYGGIWTLFQVIKAEILRPRFSYNDLRRNFTTKIILGLEFFVASDLIKTVLEPTLDRVVILGAIVAIRTVVSYSLDKEIKDLGPEKE